MIPWYRWDFGANRFGAPGRLLLTPSQRQRLVQVLAKEPELEAWQIAERFGLTEVKAINLKLHLLRRIRREGRVQR